MAGILVDNDVAGECEILLSYLTSPTWLDAWLHLDLTVFEFEELGLQANAPDRLVWQACQRAEAILITANRNADGPDSLESTIRDLTRSDSWPVLTLADPRRIMTDKRYSKAVGDRLIEILFDIDSYRGVGRLYLP